MHRCLNILDILSLVFENVYMDYELGPKTIVALAMTCHRFQDPALNILWRSVPNLVPLARCLPEDAWVQEDKGGSFYNCRLIRLSRPLRDEDFYRCRIYAHRIRHIGYVESPRADSCYDIMALSWRNRIYPGLVSLVYEEFERYGLIPIIKLQSYFVKSSTQLAALHRVIGPETKALDVSFYTGNTAGHWLPGSMITSLPSTIRALRFRTHYLPFEPSNFAHILLNLSHLEILHLPTYDLDREVFRVIMSSRTLQELEISIQSTQAEASVTALPKQQPLQLRCIVIRTADFDHCVKFMESIDISYLRSITVHYESAESADPPMDFPSANKLEAFFRFLRSSCSLHNLKKVTFVGPSTGEEPSFLDEFVVTLDTLSPLLSFPNLEYLKVRSEGGINLSDECFKEMTKSWPKMRHLQLQGLLGWGPNDEYRVTLVGLTLIAQYWTELEYLSICFNIFPSFHAVVGKGVKEICSSVVPCPALTTLCVGDSPITVDAFQVANHLHKLFPNLSVIGDEYEDVDAISEEWEKVRSILQKLNEAS